VGAPHVLEESGDVAKLHGAVLTAQLESFALLNWSLHRRLLLLLLFVDTLEMGI